MKTRIIVSAVLLPIFFAVLFIFPPFVLTVVISVLCAIAVFELFHATKLLNKRVLVYTIIAAVLTPMAVFLSFALHAVTQSTYSIMTLITLLLSIFFIFICFLVIEVVLAFKSVDSEKKFKLRQVPIAFASGMVIPLMLSALVSLKSMPYGHLLVLIPIISTFLTDSGAYFVGVAIGKRKIFPNISPNKTLEGCVGGVIAGTFGIMLYGIILSYTTSLAIMFPALFVYGLIGAVVTEFGDLVYSFIKRKCGIKDYGRLFPGHGGVLDRFDSMSFNAPVMLLLVVVIPAILV